MNKGRPKLDPKFRIAIIQNLALNAKLTIGKIEGLLVDEFGEAPSRGAIHKIAGEWKRLPDEIKARDIPYQWHRLDHAGLPWEAGEWVNECAWVLEHTRMETLAVLLDALVYPKETKEAVRAQLRVSPDVEVELPQSVQDVLADAKAFLVFTNRWATWCWRVHLAAPDLDAGHVLAIAKGYAMQEQAYDLLSERPPMDVGASNAWLVYRPDLGPGLVEMYDFAVETGLVPGQPEPVAALNQAKDIGRALTSERGIAPDTGAEGLAAGRAIFMKSYKESAKGEGDARTHSEESEGQLERSLGPAKGAGQAKATVGRRPRDAKAGRNKAHRATSPGR